jgi:hypothetical protein
LLDRQLPAGQPERADAVRCVAGEDTQGAQPQVEVDLLLPAAGVDPPHRLDQLDAVADGDVGDSAALAGHQRGDPGRRDLGVALGTGRFGVGQRPQPGEPVGVPDLRHHRRQIPVGAGEHPRQAGADDVAADQHEQPGRQVGRVVRRRLAGRRQPLRRQADPARSGMLLGAAGQPTGLPRIPGERRQPVQQLGHPAPPAGPGGGRRRDERPAGQPLPDLLRGRRSGRPAFLHRARRKLVAQLPVPGPLFGGDRADGRQRLARRMLDRGGHSVLPNSTLNACGS